MGKVWERPGRGHGSELFVFLVFPWFFAVWPKTSRTQKKKFRPMGKVWAIHTQTKKPKNQKTKKPKNQKTKKTKKTKIAHPKGRGSDAECWVLSFCFFCFFWFFGFLFFCFFGFLFFWFFVFFLFFCFFGFSMVFCSLAKNLENTKKKVQTHGQGLGYPHTNQKTKKPKNQETKKPQNQKTKKKQKKQDCTPQGEGVRCRVLGLVFLFFLFFLVFWFFGLCGDSHCRCAKQRLPGTVSGCTRSKVDTLQYSNVCYDIVHSANEQQRGMEFNFVRLRHMLLDLCTGNAAICALPQWPVLKKNI